MLNFTVIIKSMKDFSLKSITLPKEIEIEVKKKQ